MNNVRDIPYIGAAFYRFLYHIGYNISNDGRVTSVSASSSEGFLFPTLGTFFDYRKDELPTSYVRKTVKVENLSREITLLREHMLREGSFSPKDIMESIRRQKDRQREELLPGGRIETLQVNLETILHLFGVTCNMPEKEHP